MRGLFHDDPQFYFHCAERGFSFGNTGGFVWEKKFFNASEVQEWIKSCYQGWAISNSVEIQVRSRRTSFWSWSWKFQIPQGEQVDLVKLAEKFPQDFNSHIEEFKAAYRLKASQGGYHTSEFDRYYPDVSID